MLRNSKLFKLIGIIVSVIILILALIVLALTINHQRELSREAKENVPLGEMVEIDGKKLHVFAEGEGDITLVFLSGQGTSSPVFDFKPLWSRFIDEYRIVVVERTGYGWSETSSTPRDIGTILEETRKVLEVTGETGPYVLFPHSMSGLEAIYWAQEYPDEVKAIIGLDPLIPDTVELVSKPSKIQLSLMYFISRIGVSRLMPESELGNNLPLMKSEELSEKDKDQYLSLFYKSTLTKDMLREVSYLSENSKTVSNNEIPTNIPMHFFISKEQDATVSGWEEALIEYLSQVSISKHMQLDTGHYIHYEKADIIVEESKTFIEGLK